MRVLLTVILLLSVSVVRADNWWNYTVREDAKYFYYIGVSDNTRNLKVALKEAYAEAIIEAVRHQYGYEHSYSENYFANLKEQELSQELNFKSSNVRIKGIAPKRQKVLKSAGKYTVYREIRYSKKEIKKELLRQKKSSSLVHTFDGESNGPNGEVVIKTDPPRAEIVLTGRDNDLQVVGTSNAKFKIPLGRYTLYASKEGYFDNSRQIVVSGKSTTSNIKLKRSFGEITIKTEPVDAQLYLNGKRVYQKSLQVHSGKDHKILVKHLNYYEESKTFKVGPKEEKELSIQLEPRPGSISIRSNPNGAQVYVDGRYIGKTPIKRHSISKGEHEIVLKKKNFEKETLEIEVEPNKRHSPLLVDMKYENKESFRKVASKSYKEIKKKIANLMDFKCEKGNRFNTFGYKPLAFKGSDPRINLLPITLESRICGNFSLGVEYIYYWTEDDGPQVKDEFGYDTESFIATKEQTITFMSRYYFSKSNNWHMGVGPELNMISKKIETETYYETISTESEKQSSLGVGFTALKPPTRQKRGGYQVDVRQLKIGDGSTFQVGFSLNYYF